MSIYPDRPNIQILSAEGDTHQAKRSINSVKKAFKPLESSIFEEKLVVLCDAPTVQAKAGFDEFMKEFKSFEERGQIKVLPLGSLEECYPHYEGWNRTSNQAKSMKGKQKTKLAKKIGEQITQEQFENEMRPLFETLLTAWELAY